MCKQVNEYIYSKICLHLICPAVNVFLEIDVSILELRTEHLNPNVITQLLYRKVKQSNTLCVCLTALPSFVLIKLGYRKSLRFDIKLL